MVGAARDCDTHSLALHLRDTAWEDYITLDSASAELVLYDAAQSGNDRNILASIIMDRIPRYARFLDSYVGEVNVDIPTIDDPLVAAEATRMRDDIREAKQALEQINLH